MDIVGGVRIVDGVTASIVSGVDDHSRFVISARVVERATARPVCDALAWSMRTHGVPQEILTDNGKVFTGRFGPGTGEVLFDRICRENGIKHILTAPRSPTTTGKVERWHKTLRREFLNGRVFDSIADAQAQLDRWVHIYNHERRHQGIGGVVPWERFRLAKNEPVEPVELAEEPTTTRRVGRTGKISFAAATYPVGVWLAGETVDVSVANGLMSIHHRGVLIATHAQRHRPDKETPALNRTVTRQAASSTPGNGRPERHPQGRLIRRCLLRRLQLQGRQAPHTPSGPSRHRRRDRGDLRRRRGPQGASDPPRPLPRARRLRQRRRTPITNQRRVTPPRPVTGVPEPTCRTGTGT